MSTVLIILVVLILVAGISMYNALVRRRNRVEQAFSGIDVQLVQRYELIPKLVETVRQYMGYERTVLEDIVRLRSQAMNSSTPEEKMRADSQLSQALGQLRVSVENYPELKSSDNFLQLQRALNEVEEQLAAARRSYNSAVTDYNNSVQTFPSSFVAGLTGFTDRDLYVAEEQKRSDVDMRALFNS